MSWCQSLLCYIAGIVVCLECLLRSLVLFVATGVLGYVSKVVGLHLVEEYFAFACLSIWNQKFSQQVQNLLANISQLLLDRRLVCLDLVDILIVAFIVFFFLD